MDLGEIIKTEEEYEADLARIEILMDAVPGSPELRELGMLTLMIEKYEQTHYPIDPPGLFQAILFRLDQEGLLRGICTLMLNPKHTAWENIRIHRRLN
jgi:HTH-type transcriptional regulator / antitoxin HigA